MRPYPKIDKDKIVLCRAESSTGIVLDEEFKYATTDYQKVYTIFNSENEALIYVDSLLSEHEGIEFVLYDFNHELLRVISK